ncbi:MAG: restriction endonuclease subunit S [Ruminococcus sp.]|nr:restriction endonuclease subunit S [Ruminococcus sp.]
MKNINDLIKELCPNGVEYMQLKDISVMQRGTSITKKDLIKGKIPVISGGKEPAFYCNKSNRDGETITVAGSGAGAGYVQYWDMPIFVNDAFSIKAKFDNITKYIYYCLSNLQAKIYETKTGSGIPHVNISDIENFKIPLPSLEIQQKIAEILSAQDKVIELKQKLIEQKKQQKKWLMQNLLTRKIRLKGFEGEWKKIKLKEVCEINRGGSPRPINKYITTDNNGINWIKIGDADLGCKYITSAKEKIIPEGIKNSRSVYIGDFLLSNSMSYGRPYILKIDGCIHDGWLVISKYSKNFILDYFYYSLCSESVQKQYDVLSAGSGVQNLNKDLVSQVIVRIPSVEEQTAIAEILSAQDTEIELLEKELEQVKLKKKFLMNLLLSGK